MRFKWLSKSSEQAAVCMAYARMCFKGLSVDDAVRQTLANGKHCRNADLVTDERFRRLCKAVLIKADEGRKRQIAASR